MYSIHCYRSIYNTIIMWNFILCTISIGTDQHRAPQYGGLLCILSIVTG